MHWEEDKNEDDITIPERAVDLSFNISCKALPVDHAWALYEAVSSMLPWLEEDPVAGIHPLHVAESAHGWQRPDDPDALLHLSRRTKLVLRLSQERVEAAKALQGQLLNVAGHTMAVGEPKLLLLSKSTSLFSRRVIIEEGESEEQFMQRQVEELRAIGVRPKKLLPGLGHTMNTPRGELCTLRLSLEGLSVEESFTLQEKGLGRGRHLGCGIFIAQKPLVSVDLA